MPSREEQLLLAKIYPVITPEYCGGRPVLEVLEAVLQGGANMVQLRDKTDPERYAADFRRITDLYSALFIMNDSIDLALKHQADGVHLGQEDIAVAKVRRLYPELLIGASVTSLEQALIAQQAGASYVTIGPIFPTETKVGLSDFLGLDIIKVVAPQMHIPVSAIGGINLSNIEGIVMAGARQVAMITAISEAEDVEQTTRDFIRIITGLTEV